MNDIKLIVSDIDGTLIPPGGTLSPATIAAVAECARRGVVFSLASGRWYPSTASVMQEIGVASPLIIANGGAVVSPKGDILKDFFMSREEAHAAWEILKDEKVMLTRFLPRAICRIGERYYPAAPVDTRPGYAEYRLISDDMEAFLANDFDETYKFEVYCGDLERIAQIKSRLAAAGLGVSNSWSTNIEINSPRAGKGAATKWLAAHLGLARENVMAFGDNTNDIDMLDAAGVAIAMGNAADAVKAHADIIAPDCADDGLAAIIEAHIFRN